MGWAALVSAVVTAAVAYALRPALAGSVRMWLGLGIPYVLLGALALVRLRRRRQLGALLSFRRGDPSLGILVGLAMLTATWLVAKYWLPSGAAERAWLLRVFLVLGEPGSLPGSALLIGIVLLEELVWRGWLRVELGERMEPRRAWAVLALLYGAAHLPSAFTLADPAVGKNPLLLLAALGGGLCWGFLVERSGRLAPALFAHTVFSYFAANSLWLFV